MLRFGSFFRNSTRRLPGAFVDLREFLHIGDKAAVRKHITKLQTTNRTALPGDEVLSTARLMQQFEILAASMIESNLDKDHQSAGFYLKVDHRRPAYLGIPCTYRAEVTDVTESKATFKGEVEDSGTGEIIATGVHSRVIVKAGEAMSEAIKE
jgi:predicted thioesterase